MDIRSLRYFLAAAREENMTRAAEYLHVTQPTLSRTLHTLEDELGKKLFVRHSFSISLTEEGALLRKRAEDLVGMADKIEQEFLTLDSTDGGDLYFGLAETRRIQKLAEQIRILKNTCPNLRWHVTSGDTEQVTEKLDKGLLDFAVLCDIPDSRKYEYLVFPEKDTWGAVIRADSPLASKTSVTVQDLAGHPLFASEQAWCNDIPHWAGAMMPKLHLEGSFRLSYNASLFVREGLGVLLTFDGIIDTSKESGLVFRPLSPVLETPVCLIWNRSHSFTPAAERFLCQIRTAFSLQVTSEDSVS